MLRGKLYRIVTPYAVGGITVYAGKVDFAPPVFRWLVGKSFEWLRQYAQQKNFTIESLEK